MLSTRLGYGRPAFLAFAFAIAFCAGDNGVDLFLGFFFSQTGVGCFAPAITLPLGILCVGDFILVYSLYACEFGRTSISNTQSIGMWLMSPTVSGLGNSDSKIVPTIVI